ncbi:MAG: isochorismatase family protein [Acidimicrobiales bacterium]
MTAPAYGPSVALLVVDVQNDFADPSGALYVAGGDEAVDAVNGEVAAAVLAGATIVYTQDWHPHSTPHFQKDGGIWPVHCVGNTWGAELHPRLTVSDGAETVRKGVTGEDGYSAFSVREPVSGESRGTGLDGLLRERGITEVVVAGLATDYCVRETGLDAVRLGFRATVVTAAVRAVDLEPGDGKRALGDLAAAGVHLV